ncbi:unnamed protein product [Rhizophagus irregularis]|nr:unnamed protein product [Rhizophagus irregularis]
MRAFHLSWFSFLTAFTGWFAIAPLIPTIKEDLKLTTSEVNSSNLTSIASTIIFRTLIGPLCDRFGPRRTMATLLTISAIPVGLSGLVTNSKGFITLRFFIGIIGINFVPCQFWTTQMFDGSVVGCANALVVGWGNMGAGVTYDLMPLLFDVIQSSGLSDHASWRVAAGICFVMGLTCLLFSDDCPQGDWSKRKQQVEEIHDADNEKTAEVHDANKANKTIKDDDHNSIISEKSPKVHSNPSRPTIGMFFKVLKNPNVIILMFMYASSNCSFGIELAVDNVIGYFFRDFPLSQTKAACCGSVFSIVPFVDPEIVGAISGLVVAGGNIGGLIFIGVFKIYANNTPIAFMVCGFVVMTVHF